MEEVVGKATEVEKGLAGIGVCGATPDPFSEHRETHCNSIYRIVAVRTPRKRYCTPYRTYESLRPLAIGESGPHRPATMDAVPITKKLIAFGSNKIYL